MQADQHEPDEQWNGVDEFRRWHPANDCGAPNYGHGIRGECNQRTDGNRGEALAAGSPAHHDPKCDSVRDNSRLIEVLGLRRRGIVSGRGFALRALGLLWLTASTRFTLYREPLPGLHVLRGTASRMLNTSLRGRSLCLLYTLPRADSGRLQVAGETARFVG